MNPTPLFVITALCFAFSLAVFFVRERIQRAPARTDATQPRPRRS